MTQITQSHTVCDFCSAMHPNGVDRWLLTRLNVLCVICGICGSIEV